MRSKVLLVDLCACPWTWWAPPHPYDLASLCSLCKEWHWPPFLQLLLHSFPNLCLGWHIYWKVFCNLTTPLLLLSCDHLHHLLHTTTNALSMRVCQLSNVSFDLPILPVLSITMSRTIFLLFICTINHRRGLSIEQILSTTDRWSTSPVDSLSQWINKCYI